MAGLKEWVLQVSWFINAIILNVIAFSVVVFFLQYDFNGPQTAVLLNVPATIVWACIILYCIANIAFCFLFTSIFHNCKQTCKSVGITFSGSTFSVYDVKNDFHFSDDCLFSLHPVFLYFGLFFLESLFDEFVVTDQAELFTSYRSVVSRISKNSIF